MSDETKSCGCCESHGCYRAPQTIDDLRAKAESIELSLAEVGRAGVEMMQRAETAEARADRYRAALEESIRVLRSQGCEGSLPGCPGCVAVALGQGALKGADDV
jgi:hypothetical protein